MAACTHGIIKEVSDIAICMDCGQPFTIHTNMEFNWDAGDFIKNVITVSIIKTYRPVLKQPVQKAKYYGTDKD